jgi:hypothetical protein
LETISTSALDPGAGAAGATGTAPLSACNMKKNAAERIALHLTLNGSRRRASFQVTDLVHRAAVRAMPRSDCLC